MERRNTQESIASSADDSICEYSANLAQIEALYHRSQQQRWSLSMDRQPGRKLGMHVAPALEGTALVVTRISEKGQVWSWNERQGRKHLRCGDLLLDVCGISGDSEEMENALRTSGAILSLHIMRLVRFSADLTVSSWSCDLGLIIDDQNIVQAVPAGSPAAQYKALVPPELCVRPGDRILAINEEGGRTWRQRMFGCARKVEVVLERPNQGDLPWKVGCSNARERKVATTAMFPATDFSALEQMQGWMPEKAKADAGRGHVRSSMVGVALLA